MHPDDTSPKGSLGSAVLPTERDVHAILAHVRGQTAESCSRFPTGLCHWVYDVRTTDGQVLVVRIATAANRHYLAGAVHWSKALRPLGLPLPEILHADLDPSHTPFPYMILQRLPGRDLGDVYNSMSPEERCALARRVADLQGRVATLPMGDGYGYVSDPSRPPPHRTCQAAVEAGLQRSERWLASAGLVSLDYVARVREATERFEGYFAAVRPTAFLDDLTTKNVLVHEGRLSGIVDTDEVCYGDPLSHLGLLRMALMGSHHPTDYVDAWIASLRLRADQRRALDLYTAHTCLCFLAEQGQAFNRPAPPPPDWQAIAHLRGILDWLLQGLLG